MKTRKLRSLCKRLSRDERGVALLMSLGILAMVSLMAVAFATTALFSQHMAALSREIVQARLYSEAAMQRIHSTLNVELADPNNRRNLFPPTRKGIPNHFGPATASTAWDGRTYWASTSDDTDGIRSALALDMAGVDITPEAIYPMLDEEVGWLPVFDDETGGVNARYCYIVIDESGKIDPNNVIKKGQVEGSETATRIGNFVTDYNLTAAISNASKFQFVGDGDGELPVGLQWLSYFHIFKTNSSAVANADEILNDVIFPRSYDLQVWNNADKDKHRFNLTAADWDSFDNSIDDSGITEAASEFWSGTDIASNEGGIDWLANCEDEDLRDQVAANLIDYCDSDSIPTTDSEWTSADGFSVPTYMGIEATPFLNEFIVQMLLYDDLTTNRPDYYLDINIWTEMVNMWPDAAGNGGIIEVEFAIESTDLPSSPLTLTKTWTLAADIPAESYQTLPAQSHTEDLGNRSSLAGLSVTIVEARFYIDTADGKQLWDFAQTSPSSVADVVPLVPRWVNAETDDPRQNTDTSDWLWSEDVVGGTDGITNDACNPEPPTPHDQEDGAVDPWDVSTAYIRNDTIECLWELGAIHRNASWQSINLKSFNESSVPTVGMDTYSLGDANILDQVKLTSDNYHHGAINFNSHHPSVLAGILVGLSIGDTYEAPTGSGTTITLPEAQAMIGPSPDTAVVGQWLYENGSAGVVVPMHSLGGLGRVKSLTNGTVIAQTTDRAREEIIGKIAGIGSVRSNFFSVILTTQTVKDLATGVNGGVFGEYDAGVDKILAKHRVYYQMYRDAVTNKFRIIHFEYIDI